MSKKAILLSAVLCLPLSMQASPLIGIVGGVLGIGAGAAAIGGLVLPTAVGYHAGCQREELQREVENFKKGLTSDQQVAFAEKYQPIDTKLATKLPFGMQVAGLGFTNKVIRPNSISYQLSPMGKMIQLGALAVACGDEYAEYKNRRYFEKAQSFINKEFRK